MDKTDNKLIAEFMGFNYQISIGPFGGEYPQVYDTKQINHYEPEAPKWDKSWDWLMPVVEKINKSQFDDMRGIELIEAIHKYVCRVQILDAHMYVVEFIKWYNSQRICTKCKTPNFCKSNIDKPCIVKL